MKHQFREFFRRKYFFSKLLENFPQKYKVHAKTWIFLMWESSLLFFCAKHSYFFLYFVSCELIFYVLRVTILLPPEKLVVCKQMTAVLPDRTTNGHLFRNSSRQYKTREAMQRTQCCVGYTCHALPKMGRQNLKWCQISLFQTRTHTLTHNRHVQSAKWGKTELLLQKRGGERELPKCM